MLELIAIGIIGGVVTGLSPCILPVLPIILTVSVGRRPSHVVAGLAISFSAIMLLGTILLSALGLPKDLLRWLGVAMLVAVGLGMVFPKLGSWLEAPFDLIPRPTALQNRAKGHGGFVLGLALGAVYVPCAGPILAAITVAGATGDIGLSTVVLTLSFAVGAAIPLFFFALAGSKIGDRVDAVRRHTRAVGVVIIALALALATNAPERLQRAVPDWTAGIQRSLGENTQVQQALGGGGSLAACRTADPSKLQDCGPAPELAGLTGWFNTEQPVTLGEGKVTLVDFWAYACINCQRAGEHITKLYDTYQPAGLQVLGVHAPEYGFEHEVANVQAAAKREGIHYPVAQDNDFETWKNFNNRYWPARYLVDKQGNVRHIHEGEGAYAETEQLIRQLLQEANPGVQLPAPVEGSGMSERPGQLTERRNPETYFGFERAQYFANSNYGAGSRHFDAVTPKTGQYALAGDWTVNSDHIVPQRDASLQVNIHAAHVQAVVSGSGMLEVTTPDGARREYPVADGTVDVLRSEQPVDGIVSIIPHGEVTMYSLTFG
ncbi:cytochrome c biogenesis protein DipZ [Corynebacterium epidermidicanis]|uniref:Cytochrome c biogenesis protein n=1 Tax=Corynebacterium epidermidicanis TaxID=1050174 RepID=A0A0G3GN50_9CORY|nr:cytochrome c biogenesis protein DipZ [Corynebacterium epidermidicanis]AKK01985.1 cytochrome c biogenesis protein [Corynebacterium epidermidicanis]